MIRMKQITKALGIIGMFALVITISYFLYLYSSLTQLILVLGFAGAIFLAKVIYDIEWMVKTDSELRDIHGGIDKAIDYMREHIEKPVEEIKLDRITKQLKKELSK